MSLMSSLAKKSHLGVLPDASQANYASSSQPRAPPPRPSLDLPALQEASRLIHEQLIKDAQIVPDLADMLTIPGGQSSASYTIFPGDFRVPFQKRKHASIPAALWEHFQSPQIECHMGIIPEIERAWITMDHKLFLWDYVEGQELCSFIEQPNKIAHVGLVKPKPNVFIDEITHLLVICTPVTVILLGLSTQPSSGPEYRQHSGLKLYATDITVSTDGVKMNSVTSTSDGRIFMCGVGDGCIYELHYQEKEVWFGKRFHLINHSAKSMPSFIPLLRTPQNEERVISLITDRPRNCIYSLSEHNWISIWRPEPNQALRRIQTLSNLPKQVQDKAPGAPALAQGLRLFSLHIIDQRESKAGVQLMALSQNGVRLYFSPAPAGYSGYGYGSQYGVTDPKHLHLVHVRLPPISLPHPDEQFRSQYVQANPHGPSQQGLPPPIPCFVNDLTAAAYVDGILVASQPSDMDGKDFLLGVAPDLSKIGSLGQTQTPANPQAAPQSYYYSVSTGGYTSTTRQPLTEQATMLYLEGAILSIAAVIPNTSLAGAIPPASPEPLSTNELATQFSQPQHEFVILSNAGISHLVKRRVLDYLRDALEESQNGGNLQQIMEFRDTFGRDQTCAMLLALASGNTFLSVDRNRYALYEEVGNVGPDVAAVAKQALYDLADRPIWVERGYSGDSHGSIIFSGRREGLALYFARLVRPLWKAKVTKPGLSGQGSNFDDRTLVTIQRNLYALKNMLDSNPQLFGSAPGEQVGAGSRQNVEHEAWKVEVASVSSLQSLLARTVEAISFVLLLIDYHIGDLVAQCDKETQAVLSGLTYEELITSENGLRVSRTLVNVIINSQIGQQISIDTVSEILQQRCGSFCSADDVLLYKAQENARKAVDIRDPNEKQVVLGESLRLFTRAARAIEFEKLREICGDYQHLNYAKGAVELPLQCATISDDGNVGLNYWLAGSPAKDPRSAEALDKRKRCYDLILHSLSVFDDQCAKNPMRHDFVELRNYAYDLAFSSEDPIFHSHLYEWMVKRGMTDTLLQIRPVFLEAHLLREPASTDKYQLLWQLYVKTGQFLRAAEVLSALARSSEFDLTLESRLEYLTLAVSTAKSHQVSASEKHETAIAFLSELEDQLDVAQVQMDLLHALHPRINDPEVGEKIQHLQRRLFNITELYQLYAEPFDLPSIKLLILHVSEHRDEAVVKPIWNAMFDEATSTGTPDEQADRISSLVVTHGKKFYPSESAFPIRLVAELLVRFSLSNMGVRGPGWAPRMLRECGVPYPEIWDTFHEMYESQVPPFNTQDNIQAVSSDIAVLLKDWVTESHRTRLGPSQSDLPIDVLDRTIAKYVEELAPARNETRATFEEVKRQLQHEW